jgi:hypothetical protein
MFLPKLAKDGNVFSARSSSLLLICCTAIIQVLGHILFVAWNFPMSTQKMFVLVIEAVIVNDWRTQLLVLSVLPFGLCQATFFCFFPRLQDIWKKLDAWDPILTTEVAP